MVVNVMAVLYIYSIMRRYWIKFAVIKRVSTIKRNYRAVAQTMTWMISTTIPTPTAATARTRERERERETYGQSDLDRSNRNGNCQIQGRAANSKANDVQDVPRQLQPEVEGELITSQSTLRRPHTRACKPLKPSTDTYANQPDDPALPGRNNANNWHGDRQQGIDPLPNPSTGSIASAQECSTKNDSNTGDLYIQSANKQRIDKQTSTHTESENNARR
jgi:hypothetical protein